MPIRDKIASWVKSEWRRWEEEKSDWFTDQWKSTVPEDMTPKLNDENDSVEETTEEAEKEGDGEQNVRKKSLVEQMLDGNELRRRTRRTSKVVPAGRGSGEEEELDVEDFKRELKRRSNRRGSVKL